MEANGPNQISVSRRVNQKRLRTKNETRGELSFFYQTVLSYKGKYISLWPLSQLISRKIILHMTHKPSKHQSTVMLVVTPY